VHRLRHHVLRLRRQPHVESVESSPSAIQLFGAERLLRTPDCGFATFADNRLNSDRIAQAKLAALALVQILRQRRYSA
jgi:5-methyltetrahydropteroyltriglutamate--homocysteine methyltransferase